MKFYVVEFGFTRLIWIGLTATFWRLLSMFKTLISREKLAENVRELVMRFSRTKVQKETGLQLRTLDNYLSGDSEPKVTAALAMAKVLETTVEYLVLREGPKSFSPQDIEEYQTALNSVKDSTSASYIPVKKRDALEDLYKAHQVLLHMKRDSGLKREHLSLRSIDSDSMEGFNKGDLVLVDTSDKELSEGNLFFFTYMNAGLIREASLVPGHGWLLRTNNDKHEDQLFDLDKPQMNIEGRIVGATKFY